MIWGNLAFTYLHCQCFALNSLHPVEGAVGALSSAFHLWQGFTSFFFSTLQVILIIVIASPCTELSWSSHSMTLLSAVPSSAASALPSTFSVPRNQKLVVSSCWALLRAEISPQQKFTLAPCAQLQGLCGYKELKV